ncbi:hypothetical protein Ddye_021669 [Dipteronia dyeriana]|uniref:Uncharacterized protein n=1 Tax=Dipteronia dyeriana TaxID=168575 RepID=A0AAD9U340_9ROSI|nr:hypothetical protein Ddye_021669 [Dipteronia dyeriana]
MHLELIKIISIVEEDTSLQQNIMINFMVEDTPSTYNVILGRLFLLVRKGVLSIYHNVQKFPVRDKVGEVHRDQQAARKCYVVSTNPTALAKQYA